MGDYCSVVPFFGIAPRGKSMAIKAKQWASGGVGWGMSKDKQRL